jgi:tetratricopeptide (TPR) repeat protein
MNATLEELLKVIESYRNRDLYRWKLLPVQQQLNLLQAACLIAGIPYPTTMECYMPLLDMLEDMNIGDWLEVSINHKDDEQQAITLLSGIIEIQPEHELSLFLRGVAHARTNAFENALDDLQKLCLSQSQSNEILVLKMRGIASFDEGNDTAAIEHFTNAMALNSKDASLYYSRALVYTSLDNWLEASKDLEMLIEQYPEEAAKYVKRGLKNSILELIPFSHRQRSNAKHIDFTTFFVAAYADYGREMLSTQNYASAIDALSVAFDLDPSNSGAVFLRGYSKCYHGDYAGAMVDLSRFQELEPHTELGEVFYLYGECKRKLLDFEGALADLNAAIAFNNQWDRYYYSRAFVRLKLGDTAGYREDRATYERLRDFWAPF